MDKIINSFTKCYLIGPMEKTKAKDSGRGWRDSLRPELEKLVNLDKNPVYVFDPTLEEQNKVGMETEVFHKKLMGWIKAGNNNLIADGTDLIWHGKTYLKPTGEHGKGELVHIMGDIDYVRSSDFLIARMEKGDSPCGTFMEVGITYEHRIPIYVIQTMNREDYPVSFVGAVFGSGGDFFPTQNKLIEFLISKYQLKIKKDI